MLTRWAIIVAILYLIAGCSLVPEIAHQPTYHNPFPQLRRVGIAPFSNKSTERTLDDRAVAIAYGNELQSIPGYEVVPVGIVENKAYELGNKMSSAKELRELAVALELDAIVVGAITDYSPYYPPRMALHVDWYAANPGFHPIPAGYGLPWGSPEEEDIPQSLVQAAEFELARKQLDTQTPDFIKPAEATEQAEQLVRPGKVGVLALQQTQALDSGRFAKAIATDSETSRKTEPVNAPKIEDSKNKSAEAGTKTPVSSASRSQSSASSESGAENFSPENCPPRPDGLPADWPDPSGFVPPPPRAQRPAIRESSLPVLTHVRSFNGHDVEFTKALASYVTWRDDARYGGWKGYLQRSDDFIRFCCHMHITEMLTARGGAGESRVVWRWFDRR